MSQTNTKGETIKLSQGEEAPIKLPNDRPLTKIVVGVGWDPALGGARMDVDSSVIVAGDGGYETVFYGSLTHPSGCVEHHGDSLTGEGCGENGEDESIAVYLDKVPQNRDKLIFVLNIYDCFNRCQTLSDVRNMHIFLYDPASGEPLIEYRPDTAMNNDTAIVIGAVYRRGGGWTFKAIGEGSLAVSVHDLANEVVRKY